MQHAAAMAFVRDHTAPTPVPLTPEITLYLAREMTPLWQATQRTLTAWETSPFWAFPWVGGQAVARYVLDHPELVRNRRVLDFGAGSGLVAIAAAKAGAASVTACDIDPLFSAVLELNAGLNGVEIAAWTRDVLGQQVSGFDVVLAGDIFYEKPLAESAWRWFGALAAAGALVLVGDPGRLYSPAAPGLLTCASYLVPTTTEIESAPERRTLVQRVPPVEAAL